DSARPPPIAETQLAELHSQDKTLWLNPLIVSDPLLPVNFAACDELRAPGILAWAASLSQSANALGVETPSAGVGMTQGIGGRWARGKTCSPRPIPRIVPPTRKSGTSDPTSAAMRNFSSGAICVFRACSIPSMAAMALEEAAPSPPCTGSRFS